MSENSERLQRLFAVKDEDEDARNELVRHFHGLAGALASRFRGRGESIDDLEQVAAIGLVNAVDRFDPERGVKFTTYATATILGELKRYLRDRAWSMHVPRGLQERSVAVHDTAPRLAQQLGRSPTIGEIAEALGYEPEDVIEALEAGSAYTAVSLDAPLGNEDGTGQLFDVIVVEDETLRMMERWTDVAEALRDLPERERHILYLRFFEDRTQSEIGTIVGVSQMHVSRLLARSLEQLRSKVA